MQPNEPGLWTRRDTKRIAEKLEILNLEGTLPSAQRDQPLEFQVCFRNQTRRFELPAGKISFDLLYRMIRYIFNIDVPITLMYSSITFDTDIELRRVMRVYGGSIFNVLVTEVQDLRRGE